MATKKVVASKVISVLVNGQVVGTVLDSSSVGAAATQIAREHGLRAYSLKLDGKKLTTTFDVNKSLKGHKSIELFAKDSRG